MKSKFPLMKNNITRNDLDKVIQHLKKKDPILTQHKNVEKFEKITFFFFFVKKRGYWSTSLKVSREA